MNNPTKPQRWPLGNYKLNNRGGNGYAVVSLLKVGRQPMHSNEVAPGEEPDTRQFYPIDIIGKTLFAEYSARGPEGPALYGVCLIHETMKLKLKELVSHHPLGLFPILTFEATPDVEGNLIITNIKEVEGIKVIVGPAASGCPGRILGLSDWLISGKELAYIVKANSNKRRSIAAGTQLLAKRWYTRIYPAIKPTIWIIVGFMIAKALDFAIRALFGAP